MHFKPLIFYTENITDTIFITLDKVYFRSHIIKLLFKSNYAGLAQSVERQALNLMVEGSRKIREDEYGNPSFGGENSKRESQREPGRKILPRRQKRGRGEETERTRQENLQMNELMNEFMICKS